MENFRYKKRLGQNFITDTNFLRSLVAVSGITRDDNVLEIGAGAGGLTRELCSVARRVVSFEIDRELEPVLQAALSGCDNVRLVFADAMKATNEFIDSLFSAECKVQSEDINSQLSKADTSQFSILNSQFKLVANLPYYITTPLIFKFLEDPACTEMAVMVQKEVAERLTAKESTEDYGALTVAVAVAADVKNLKHVGRKLFYPSPDVDSAFVSIKKNDTKFSISDRGILSKLIKSAFAMRRKTLVNNLMSGFDMSRDTAEGLLKSAGLPLNVRGEVLSPAQFAELAERIRQQSKSVR